MVLVLICTNAIVPPSSTNRTPLYHDLGAQERDALVTLTADRKVPRCLQLAEPLTCCLEHRQSFDKGAAAAGPFLDFLVKGWRARLVTSNGLL